MKMLLTLLLIVATGIVVARDVEIAIVKEPRDPEYTPARFQRWSKPLPKDAEIVDADCFLKPEALRKYKRIVIPGAPRTFSLAAYDGMNQYVEEGGLIITDSIMSGIDIDGDFKEDFSTLNREKKRPAKHPRIKFRPPTGVIAHSSVEIEKVTAKLDCPLTLGFKADEAHEMKFVFRRVNSQEGIVIFTAEAVYKKTLALPVMPFVNVLNKGKGAYIFTPLHDPFIANALSAATLDWLTDQE